MKRKKAGRPKRQNCDALKNHLTIGVENIFAFCAAIYTFLSIEFIGIIQRDISYHFGGIKRLLSGDNWWNISTELLF